MVLIIFKIYSHYFIFFFFPFLTLDCACSMPWNSHWCEVCQSRLNCRKGHSQERHGTGVQLPKLLLIAQQTELSLFFGAHKHALAAAHLISSCLQPLSGRFANYIPREKSHEFDSTPALTTGIPSSRNCCHSSPVLCLPWRKDLAGEVWKLLTD